ncbi:MAG TPA: divergent PAP2 family protein [Candidatus Pacearchaeota archaeon]|nr:divergent PAP2 family protein [Candidatus Pacearchaeota archaeon]
MDAFTQIINNQPLVAGFLAWLIAQFIKMVLALKHGINRAAFRRFWASGGFPSSHSSAVAALSAACGLVYGFGSPYFAIAAVFALIVIYDAFTLRREAGKHAEALNQIMEEVYLNKQIKIEHLKELLGHTRFEVFFGFLLGAVVAVLIAG